MKELVENVEGEGRRRTDKGEEEEEEESSVLSPISVEYEPLGVHRSVPYRPYRTVRAVPYRTVPVTGMRLYSESYRCILAST
jgi:hypothetical protein